MAKKQRKDRNIRMIRACTYCMEENYSRNKNFFYL